MRIKKQIFPFFLAASFLLTLVACDPASQYKTELDEIDSYLTRIDSLETKFDGIEFDIDGIELATIYTNGYQSFTSNKAPSGFFLSSQIDESLDAEKVLNNFKNLSK